MDNSDRKSVERLAGDHGPANAEPTPGPWNVLDFSTGTKGFIAVLTETETPQHICDVFPFGNRPGGGDRRIEQHKANARLIAAAPAMLKALIAASHALRSYQYGNSATDLAKGIADACDAAIAEATMTAQPESQNSNPS